MVHIVKTNFTKQIFNVLKYTYSIEMQYKPVYNPFSISVIYGSHSILKACPDSLFHSHSKIIMVICMSHLLKYTYKRDPINRFNSTFFGLSQLARTLISNAICHGLFGVQLLEVRGGYLFC